MQGLFVVKAFLQNNAVFTLTWPVMSHDMKPLQHIWGSIRLRVQTKDPHVQDLTDLEAALPEEWQRLPLDRIKRFTGNFSRSVQAVIRTRGGYTHY